MFGDLLIVRLKAAENALRDGRIDEAFRLASAADLRAHRRGAAVLSRLTAQYLDRARNHFRAERFTEALIDLDRAEVGGVSPEEIAELRAQVRAVSAEVQRVGAERQERLDAARQRMEGGSLTAGRHLLEGVAQQDPAAQRLMLQIDQRAADVRRLVTETERMLADGHHATAVERLRRAKSIDPNHEAVVRIEGSLCAAVLAGVRAALIGGRLGRAGDELSVLGPLGDLSAAKREWVECLATARQAAAALGAHDYPEARRRLMTLARVLPEATWVSEAMEYLRQIDDLQTALVAGPLGAAVAERGRRPAVPARPAGRPRMMEETIALAHRAPARDGLPDRLLLIVDGAGSFLVLRGAMAAIGRAACSDPADIAIFGDIGERHANLQRIEDDYFLFGSKEVVVAGRPTKHQLLRDGDRVVLGRKAKLLFRLPSRKSASAVLELSDTTKMPNDVRRVILFDRHATIGVGDSTHVSCRHAASPLVLFERDGGMWVRQKNDGHVDVSALPIELGRPMEMGGVSFVLNPWKVHSSGMSERA